MDCCAPSLLGTYVLKTPTDIFQFNLKSHMKVKRLILAVNHIHSKAHHTDKQDINL